MLLPDFETFRRLARQGNLVPVCEAFHADLLTPVGAYLRLARHSRYACLLESVERRGENRAVHVLGFDPEKISATRTAREPWRKREKFAEWTKTR